MPVLVPTGAQSKGSRFALRRRRAFVAFAHKNAPPSSSTATRAPLCSRKRSVCARRTLLLRIQATNCAHSSTKRVPRALLLSPRFCCTYVRALSLSLLRVSHVLLLS